MSDIITYPENGITYDADDAAGYLATRLSGVYSADEDFSVAVDGDLTVTVSAGQAWVRPARFRGRSIIMEQPTTLTLTAADAVRSRIDRVVLRYDAAAKKTSLLVLEGAPDSGTPTAPAITRTALIYDLCLAEIRRAAGSLSVTAGDLTDTRLDEELCGIMRDGVTGIPTEELLKQAKARIAGFEETASTSAKAAKQSEQNAEQSKTAAAGSASTATEKASEAATSADAAATSASAAQKSKTAAAGSASTAAAKASEASTSAGLAAESADAAEESRVKAEAAAKQAEAIASTDKTLTVSGAPADAKATGDALAKKLQTDSAGYVKSVSVYGNTLTLTRGDGTTQTHQLAESYTLPAATASTLGGIKVGAGLSVTAGGVLSATSTSPLYRITYEGYYDGTDYSGYDYAPVEINLSRTYDYVFIAQYGSSSYTEEQMRYYAFMLLMNQLSTIKFESRIHMRWLANYGDWVSGTGSSVGGGITRAHLNGGTNSKVRTRVVGNTIQIYYTSSGGYNDVLNSSTYRYFIFGVDDLTGFTR